MSEIRDKVIDEVAEALSAYDWNTLSEENKNKWREYLKDKVFSNEHIAIVNRKAKLPEGVFDCEQHKRIFKEAGWVKEVKDNTDTN